MEDPTPETFPTWELLAQGGTSSLEGDDPLLYPTLDFLRLQWSLPGNQGSASVHVLSQAGNLRSDREPFRQDHPIAQRSICETRLSAVTISIDQLKEWKQAWPEGHARHLLDLESSGTNQCGCRPGHAPKSPTLTCMAPPGEFITIALYVEKVLPWLVTLEQDIRAAIGAFQGPIDPQWDLIPIPLIDHISVYNTDPDAGLDALIFSQDLRAKTSQRLEKDKEIEAQPSLLGAESRSLLREYPSFSTAERNVRASQNYHELERTLDFSRVRWSLSSDNVSEAITVVKDFDDFMSDVSQGEPFTNENAVAAASICETPVSSIVISIGLLDDSYDNWHDLHYEDDPRPDWNKVPRYPNWLRHCSMCNQDAPRPGPGPRLFVEAPSRYHFVTVGQYVEQVFPWLRALEPRIRQAIEPTVPTPLAPEWHIVPFPQLSEIAMYHDEPRYGRSRLEGFRKIYVTIGKERTEERRSQAAVASETISSGT